MSAPRSSSCANVKLRPRTAAFGGLPVEQFGLILLDTKHRVLRTAVVAIGTLNTTVVQPRDIFREAALGSAAA